MPKAVPKEFRDNAVAMARAGDIPVAQLAKELGISESGLRRWVAQADIEEGARPGVTRSESAELAALRRRNRVLEERGRDPQAGQCLFRAGERPPKMMYPLVQELADDGFDVAVTCRVLGFTKQGFYAWKKRGVSNRDWENANLVQLIRQIHAEDPELGAERVWEELTLDRGVQVGLNRVERLMRENEIRSVIVRKTGSGKRAGPPVHDDLVKREFTASAPNQLWLTDITEHSTA